MIGPACLVLSLLALLVFLVLSLLALLVCLVLSLLALLVCLVLSLLALLVCLVLGLLALLDYAACIAIATNASLVEMIGPACLANRQILSLSLTHTHTAPQVSVFVLC